MISSNTSPFIVLPILFDLTLFGLGYIWSKLPTHIFVHCGCNYLDRKKGATSIYNFTP